ncbi:MAG: DUF1501 domain-containing protein [Verrucomicrobiales bacterium]|nr:DUF1501 domain-containing protein [Verrucomicrobiales bacterium]
MKTVPAGMGCGSDEHVSRRNLLKLAGLSGLAWLTPVSSLLARAAERAPSGAPARSVIVLWMAGGPSQLETFDPHPGQSIAAGTRAIDTATKGIQLAEGLEQMAEWMPSIALVRSVVSKEADHERAVYTMKTGYRPVPTVVHPAIGAILCHELSDENVDIPRHVSILPDQWPARGGYFGAQFDAFQVHDPQSPIEDVRARVPEDRRDQRLRDLEVAERAFAEGRPADLDAKVTLHQHGIGRALKIMSSEQLAAFDVGQAPASQRAAYGDTRFGRGCLAALRLIERGVRCVEVTLSGWDTHANNHELQRRNVGVLDPALAALLRDLKERQLLDSTVVLCGGEFGRTPKVNPVGGRDHWPYGFSVALAGGGIRGGQVLGATDPSGESRQPDRPVAVQDLHATIHTALGIQPGKEIVTPVGRPIAISDGEVVRELLRA